MINENKIILYGDDAREHVRNGMKKVFDAVKVTMGPSGRNVLIENEFMKPMATKDGVTVASFIKLSDKKEDMGAQLIKNVSRATADTSGDGPLPIDTKIMTPDRGLVQLKNLRVGDYICGTNGTTQEVVSYEDKGTKDLYTLILEDGREARCCYDHLWTVLEVSGSDKETLTLPLHKIIEGLNQDKKYYVPNTLVNMNKVMELNYQVPHFIMGLLFGRQIELIEGMGVKIFYSCDSEEAESIVDFINESYDLMSWLEIDHIVIENQDGDFVDIVIEALESVTGEEYFITTVEDREEFIEGLFSLSYPDMKELHLYDHDVITAQEKYKVITEVLASLGLSHNLHHKNTKGGVITLPMNINKKEWVPIDKIVDNSRKERMACIEVSNEDSLYILESFIPTHNTTTSTVLAYNLINNGIDALKDSPDINLIEFKNGMDYAVKKTIEKLKGMAIDCTTKGDIFKVAMISSNGDEEISKLVTEAVYNTKIKNKGGSIDVNTSTTFESNVEFNDALVVNSGFGKYFQFVNDNKTLSFKSDHVRVLIFDGSIGTLTPTLQRLLAECHKNDETLLMIANEFSPNVVLNITQNIRNGLKCLLINSPEYGTLQKLVLNDIATATNTFVVGGEGSGNAHLETMTHDKLGYAQNIVADEKKTYIKLGVEKDHVRKILQNKGSKQSIESVYEEINDKIANDIKDYKKGLESTLDGIKSVYEKRQTQDRIDNLSSIKATINLYGMTEVEVNEAKQRAEDAVFATTSAIEEGYVVGGGMALAKIREYLKDHLPKDKNKSFMGGFMNVVNTLQYPLYQILRNAYIQVENLTQDQKIEEGMDQIKLDMSLDNLSGFDARKREYVDNMIDSGIIDPVKVIRCALQNANSISSMALTTECLIFSDAYYSEEVASKENHKLMYE